MNRGKNNEHKKIVNNEMRAPTLLFVASSVATFYSKN